MIFAIHQIHVQEARYVLVMMSCHLQSHRRKQQKMTEQLQGVTTTGTKQLRDWWICPFANYDFIKSAISLTQAHNLISIENKTTK
jgi:hypothetical protein